MCIKSVVSRAVFTAATFLFFASVPTVAVSVLVPLALVATPAGAQQPSIPYFSRSTLGPNFGIQQPRTPSYTPSNGPATSSPSVQGDCAGCGSGKLSGNLSGIWSVTYPQGPLRVQVVHRGRTLVATLIDGNIAVPAGKVTANPMPSRESSRPSRSALIPVTSVPASSALVSPSPRTANP